MGDMGKEVKIDEKKMGIVRMMKRYINTCVFQNKIII